MSHYENRQKIQFIRRTVFPSNVNRWKLDYQQASADTQPKPTRLERQLRMRVNIVYCFVLCLNTMDDGFTEEFSITCL